MSLRIVFFYRWFNKVPLVAGRGDTHLASYPGPANFSYISSLQDITNRSHEKQKVGSITRVTL